jgi:hypothetical protein
LYVRNSLYNGLLRNKLFFFSFSHLYKRYIYILWDDCNRKSFTFLINAKRKRNCFLNKQRMCQKMRIIFFHNGNCWEEYECLCEFYLLVSWVLCEKESIICTSLANPLLSICKCWIFVYVYVPLWLTIQ